MKSNKPLEAVVETTLDEFRNRKDVPPIWEIKPKHIGGKGTAGKPDRIWLIRGGLWGIEAKRVMSKSNASTLPTVIQTRELLQCIESGGAGCVVDLENMQSFMDCLIRCKFDLDVFLRSKEYLNDFCIDNWGRYPTIMEF